MKPVFLILSLLASGAIGASGSGALLGEGFHKAAQEACVMSWKDEANDEALKKKVFLPVATQLAGQIRAVFGNGAAMPDSGQTQQYLPGGQQAQNTTLPEISGNDLVVLGNAAGGVADMIIERYRETFREAGEPVPTLVTYRSPGEEREEDISRIAEDVRTYCAKLRERGVSELFPSGRR